MATAWPEEAWLARCDAGYHKGNQTDPI